MTSELEKRISNLEEQKVTEQLRQRDRRQFRHGVIFGFIFASAMSVLMWWMDWGEIL